MCGTFTWFKFNSIRFFDVIESWSCCFWTIIECFCFIVNFNMSIGSVLSIKLNYTNWVSGNSFNVSGIVEVHLSWLIIINNSNSGFGIFSTEFITFWFI